MVGCLPADAEGADRDRAAGRRPHECHARPGGERPLGAHPGGVAATIEAATRTSLPWRQRTTSYRFNFHKVSKAGWKYIEDDVDRYCPDRELILKLYEEADRLMHR